MSLDPPSAFRRLGSGNSESLVDDRSDCLRPIHQVLLGILIEAGGPGLRRNHLDADRLGFLVESRAGQERLVLPVDG